MYFLGNGYYVHPWYLYYHFETEDFDPFVFGASPLCKPLGLSCLRKIEEIIRDKNLPETDFYVLPMKLPNRCVTQQLCLLPPNPFYNKLGGQGGAYLA